MMKITTIKSIHNTLVSSKPMLTLIVGVLLVSCSNQPINENDEVSTLLNPDEQITNDIDSLLNIKQEKFDTNLPAPVIRDARTVDLSTLAVPDESLLIDVPDETNLLDEEFVSVTSTEPATEQTTPEEFNTKLNIDITSSNNSDYVLIEDSLPNDASSNKSIELVEEWKPQPLVANELKVSNIIYFGYDQYKVLPKYQFSLKQHAKLLKSKPNYVIVLEGHTDERGSREYNIALGENRANSVADLLFLFGVKRSQVLVVSFGEEKPFSKKHNEKAWTQNRRVEIVYEESE